MKKRSGDRLESESSVQPPIDRPPFPRPVHDLSFTAWKKKAKLLGEPRRGGSDLWVAQEVPQPAEVNCFREGDCGWLVFRRIAVDPSVPPSGFSVRGKGPRRVNSGPFRRGEAGVRRGDAYPALEKYSTRGRSRVVFVGPGRGSSRLGCGGPSTSPPEQ